MTIPPGNRLVYLPRLGGLWEPQEPSAAGAVRDVLGNQVIAGLQSLAAILDLITHEFHSSFEVLLLTVQPHPCPPKSSTQCCGR